MNSVLLLNETYEPLSVCSLNRAMILMINRRATVLENSDRMIHSVSQAFEAPAVMKLNYYVRRGRREIPLTKRNVLRRDGFVCQYCGAKGTAAEMTVDHVIPKCQAGSDSWENLVCACIDCNLKKSDKTISKAGMPLKRKPRKPHFFTFVLSSVSDVPDSWRPYLFLS